MSTQQPVTIEVVGGPRLVVPTRPGMNVRQALEAAYDEDQADRAFTYALQYYGPELGYLVMMINENYDSFDIAYEPDFYWQMRVNGTPAVKGVDEQLVEAGDIITFDYVMRRGDGSGPMAEAKHDQRHARRGPR